MRDLKADEVTDVLDDATGRAKYVAVCKTRDKITAADFSNAGARRLFAKATGDADYVGSLAVVASERAGAGADAAAACVEPVRPAGAGGGS